MVRNLITRINHEQKIPKPWLEKQFKELKLNESVLNLMQKPLEGKPWAAYKSMIISQTRVNNGKQFINKHQPVLKSYEQKYKIPASVVTAIIGIETSYGRNKGNFNVLEALSTLAFYYTPRSQYFYQETVALLTYAYKHKLDIDKIKSSYAGAIGIPQFMPSNIEKYGIKHNTKGKVNLYSNTDDAIASVFNYLKVNGQWQPDQPVMRKVRLSDSKRKALQEMLADTRMLKVDKKIEQLFNLRHHNQSWLIKLQQKNGDYEYFRVFHNFKAIMRYNNSVHYSSAVFQLSEKLEKFM
tara:strand:+ start:343 stop:1230 length:888 start_codon:yes stop_codon:yes gene_type:complete